MLLLVLRTAVVKKKSLNTSFLIKYNEKVAVAENEEKNKENEQTRAMIYLLTLPLPLSESTILNTKTFVHYLSKYF